MKQNLLGSQKCYLSVSVVSLQLFILMIDSLIHFGKLSIIYLSNCRNFLWQIHDRFSHEIFIVGSLNYYVLTVIFVALE